MESSPRSSSNYSKQSIDRMASMDEQMRKLVPYKVSDDDKLIEYDLILLDRFLDILQDLHGEEIRDKVHTHCGLRENMSLCFYKQIWNWVCRFYRMD